MRLVTNPTPLDTTQSHPVFSFANAELGPFASRFIRAMEKVTGQPKIKKLYCDYVDDNRPNELFWADALERLNITPNLIREAGAYVPTEGPALVIANHPFGVIDGLILCSIIAAVRNDYQIITHQVLRQAPAVKDKILPIDFSETEAALAVNLETRRVAQKTLKDGGVVIIFPAGGIATAPNFIGKPVDSEWKTFAAKMAMMKDTTILPFFFNGRNSVVYQMARRLSVTLGYSLMFREICKQMNGQVDVICRTPIHSQDLTGFTDRNKVTEFLRARTYGQI